MVAVTDYAARYAGGEAAVVAKFDEIAGPMGFTTFRDGLTVRGTKPINDSYDKLKALKGAVGEKVKVALALVAEGFENVDWGRKPFPKSWDALFGSRKRPRVE
ncbi:unnamed protein product [Closterium sp. Yama58-4]|nr:unnamed protein product [Closterium sp. Yama58-4]